MLRERVNPANERTLILWSGVCPLLNWFYWGEGWEIEKGVRKGSNCFKTLDKKCDHPLAVPLLQELDPPEISFYVCLNSGLGASSFEWNCPRRERY